MRCRAINRNGKRCKKKAEMDGFCMFHFLREVGENKGYKENVKKAFKECLNEAKN